MHIVRVIRELESYESERSRQCGRTQRKSASLLHAYQDSGCRSRVAGSGGQVDRHGQLAVPSPSACADWRPLGWTRRWCGKHEYSCVRQSPFIVLQRSVSRDHGSCIFARCCAELLIIIHPAEHLSGNRRCGFRKDDRENPRRGGELDASLHPCLRLIGLR